MHPPQAQAASGLPAVFLPMTAEAVSVGPTERAHPELRAAQEAAAGCWFAMLGGCDSHDRHDLPARLDALARAISTHLDARGGADDLRDHRRRLSVAQHRIGEAVLDGDGAEYAEAFADFDGTLATAVMTIRHTAAAGEPRT